MITNVFGDNCYSNLWAADNIFPVDPNNYDYQTDYMWRPGKTIYDPSPYGFMVPHNSFSACYTKTGQPAHWPGEVNGAVSTNQNRLPFFSFISCGNSPDVRNYFYMLGLRDPRYSNDVVGHGRTGLYWKSGTVNINTGSSLNFYQFDFNASPNHHNSNPFVSPDKIITRSDACPVRPQIDPATPFWDNR